MRRGVRQRLKRVRSLQGWWAIAVVGWIYGLPGFLTDGRWWWGALGNETAQRVAVVAAGTALLVIGLIAIRRLDRVAGRVASQLRR